MAFTVRGDVVDQKPEIKAMTPCPRCQKIHSGQCQQVITAEGTNVQTPRQ